MLRVERRRSDLARMFLQLELSSRLSNQSLNEPGCGTTDTSCNYVVFILELRARAA